MNYSRDKIIAESNSIVGCRNILNEINKDTTFLRHKIAILSNYTLKGLAECLKVKSHIHRFALDVYEGQYGQWRQEILNEDLYNFNPELIFIFVDFFGPDEQDYFKYGVSDFDPLINSQDKSGEIIKYIKILKSKTKAKIIISNNVKPSFPLMGILENKIEKSYLAGIDLYNQSLVRLTVKDNQLFIFDMDRWLAELGKESIWNTKFYYLADMRLSPDSFPNLAEELMYYLVPLFGKKKKCIILDLDNTIWGGIIGEDGLSNIELGPTNNGKPFFFFQKILKFFKNRGILLAICSKNNEDDIKEVFAKHPYMVLKEGDFVSMRINWLDKATNIKSIVEELNIGLDSVVFIDDDPTNTQLVSEVLKEVDVITLPQDRTKYFSVLLKYKELSTFEYTNEDSKRTDMYLSDKKRKDLEKKSINIDDFLEELEINLIIKPIDNFSLIRSVQLTQKTNQFNLTTYRYTEENLKELWNNTGNKIWTLQVIDRFGDHGIVGLCIIKDEKKHWEIDTFLLSCRILGRKIEVDFINFIINDLKNKKYKNIVAKYIATPKNSQVKEFYNTFGFIKTSSQEGSDIWELSLDEYKGQSFGFKIIN